MTTENQATQTTIAETPPALAHIENLARVALDELLPRVHELAQGGARLIGLTGCDHGGSFEVIYSFDQQLAMSHLSVQLPAGQNLPSITGEYLCAFLAENELGDLFGLQVEGMPLDYHNRLILTEDSPNHPLLKGSQG